MFLDILRACGRGFVAVLEALWDYVLQPVLGGIADALRPMVRRLFPWFLAGVVVLYLYHYQLETLNALLSLAIFCGIVYAGFRVATRRSGGRQERRRS